MRSLPTVATLLLTIATAVLGAPGVKEKPAQDDAVKAELKKLEGVWRIVKVVVGGKEDEAGDTVTFSGEKVSHTLGGIIGKDGKPVVIENTFTIDPTREPKRMDTSRSLEKDVLQSIYELSGDSLKVVVQADKSKPRPTEFKSNVGTQEVLIVYERIKPKK